MTWPGRWSTVAGVNTYAAPADPIHDAAASNGDGGQRPTLAPVNDGADDAADTQVTRRVRVDATGRVLRQQLGAQPSDDDPVIGVLDSAELAEEAAAALSHEPQEDATASDAARAAEDAPVTPAAWQKLSEHLAGDFDEDPVGFLDAVASKLRGPIIAEEVDAGRLVPAGNVANIRTRMMNARMRAEQEVEERARVEEHYHTALLALAKVAQHKHLPRDLRKFAVQVLAEEQRRRTGQQTG